MEVVCVVQYVNRETSYKLLDKYADISIYGFDYLQSAIWSPLRPIYNEQEEAPPPPTRQSEPQITGADFQDEPSSIQFLDLLCLAPHGTGTVQSTTCGFQVLQGSSFTGVIFALSPGQADELCAINIGATALTMCPSISLNIGPT